MHEELDYCNESDNVRAFRSFHERHAFVLIPEVIGHRSSKRVLTLSYLPGDHVRDLDALGYTADERDRCAANLWHAIESQIHDYGRIHADPNPANFAFRKDGSVVLYDFGCVKTLAPGIAASCRALVATALQEDYSGVERELVRLGVRRTSGPAVSPEFYKRWRDLLALPILASDPFDFGTARFEHDVMTTLAPDALKHFNSFQPSSEMVFLNRAVVGLYAMLRRLRARIHVVGLLRARSPELAHWYPA
jgi:predicted unusual protein kinase regulating ubiquinone biosynthesis (AarF/ABC1/UbiB family)